MVFIANWILSIKDYAKLIYWLHVSQGFKMVGILGIILVLCTIFWECLSLVFDGKEINKKVIAYAVVLLILFLDMVIFLPTESLAKSMGIIT